MLLKKIGVFTVSFFFVPLSFSVEKSPFETLCETPGVVLCVGFDSQKEIYPFVDPNWDDVIKARFDSKVSFSGKGSLRFDIPPFSPADTSGNWSVFMGKNFGPGDTFYVQFRQKFTKEMIETKFKRSDGWKQVIFHKKGRTCGNVELATQNIFMRGFPQMYSACGDSGLLVPLENGDYMYQGGDFFCTYRNQSPENCAFYRPDIWMTFAYEVKLGRWGKPESQIKAWVGYEGEPLKLYIDRKNFVLDYDDGPSDVYNTITFLPYQTNKDPNQDHPVASTWYDELIISTKPLFK